MVCCWGWGWGWGRLTWIKWDNRGERWVWESFINREGPGSRMPSSIHIRSTTWTFRWPILDRIAICRHRLGQRRRFEGEDWGCEWDIMTQVTLTEDARELRTDKFPLIDRWICSIATWVVDVVAIIISQRRLFECSNGSKVTFSVQPCAKSTW